MTGDREDPLVVAMVERASEHQPSDGISWARAGVWLAGLLVDSVIVVIGIYQYFFHPLDGPYPFVWLFDLVGAMPPPAVAGLMTFFSVGVTPIAALSLLFHSIARLVLPDGPHPAVRLLIGTFCVVVGVGFLTTLLVYILRAPQVLDWDREFLAAMVHLLIAARGWGLIAEASPRCGRQVMTYGLAGSILWLGAVTIPQHPWLVVWGHTLRDWLGS